MEDHRTPPLSTQDVDSYKGCVNPLADPSEVFKYPAFISLLFFFFFFFGCAACGKLSPLTGDWTCTSCFGSVNLHHQTASEVPRLLIWDITFVVDDFLPLLHVCLYWWAFAFAIVFFLVVVFFSTERSSFSTCLKLVWFGGAEFSSFLLGFSLLNLNQIYTWYNLV